MQFTHERARVRARAHELSTSNSCGYDNGMDLRIKRNDRLRWKGLLVKCTDVV
jgi:hypothetical protein